MKIYIAGSVSGKGYKEVMAYYKNLLNLFESMGFQTLYPMLGKEYLRNEEEFKSRGYGQPISTNHAIFERDKWMVTQCDILFVDFSQSEKVSIGSCFEIAWAASLGIHVISIIPEGNPHKHAFVLEASDIVFSTRDEALNYLEALSKGRVK